MNVLRLTSPSKCTLPVEMNPALARILAHICGDGYICIRRASDKFGPFSTYRRHPFRYRYDVGYCNTNPHLLDEFYTDVGSVFGRKAWRSYRRFDVKFSSKRAHDFLKNLGAGDSRSWFIHKIIGQSSRDIIKNWIRAFYDDEGWIEKYGSIRLKSINRTGLRQVKVLLAKLGIPSHITPSDESVRYSDGTSCLAIFKKDAGKFLGIIKPLRLGIIKTRARVAQW